MRARRARRRRALPHPPGRPRGGPGRRRGRRTRHRRRRGRAPRGPSGPGVRGDEHAPRPSAHVRRRARVARAPRTACGLRAQPLGARLPRHRPACRPGVRARAGRRARPGRRRSLVRAPERGSLPRAAGSRAPQRDAHPIPTPRASRPSATAPAAGWRSSANESSPKSPCAGVFRRSRSHVRTPRRRPRRAPRTMTRTASRARGRSSVSEASARKSGKSTSRNRGRLTSGNPSAGAESAIASVAAE